MVVATDISLADSDEKSIYDSDALCSIMDAENETVSSTGDIFSTLVKLDGTSVIDDRVLKSITDVETEELIELIVKADDSFNDIDGTMIDDTDMLNSVIVSELEVAVVDGKTVAETWMMKWIPVVQ
jgi:hypothetical protein